MVLKAALIGLAILLILTTLTRARKTSYKFAIKENLNSIKMLIILPFACYLLIGGLILNSYVVEWALLQQSSLALNSNSYFVISWAPYIELIATFYFFYRITVYSNKPWFKYTEIEQAWVEKCKAIEKAKLLRIKTFLHLNKQNKIGGL